MEQNIIGTTIAALRREKGLTQDALAAQLGVSAQAVSKWENGLSCPDILMLPEIAEYFGVSVDALFGRASVSAEVSAAPAPAEPVVVYHDLPWSDEETVLHAVLFVGHKLVGHTPFSRGARERVNVDFRYDGPALDIKSEFSVICGANTTVAGDVNAGDGVQCGNVLGHVNAGDSVTCGNVDGNVHAGDSVDVGDSVTCGNVDGNVHAGDSVECRDVEGGVTAGDGVRCGNIRGRVVAGDSVTCTGLAPDKD